MYCKVHRPVNTPGVSDNKGKCVQLVEYLSKELKEERPYYDNFFSQKEDYVTPLTVMHHMDNNHRTLKRNDDKFYMLTINPSGEEQQPDHRYVFYYDGKQKVIFEPNQEMVKAIQFIAPRKVFMD